MKTYKFIYIGMALLSCNQSVELKPTSELQGNKTGIFESDETHNHASDGIVRTAHEVEVIQHIRGKRYSYCEVRENNQTYWLATMGGDFEEGNNYAYNEGIEKTEYRSTELDRTFDRILLVSALYSKDKGQKTSAQPSETVTGPVKDIVIPETSIRIKELVQNSSKYANKVVEITGKITKVNPSIMDRNWIHIADGSMNSYDFVCTSNEAFPVGHVVTLKGKVAVNKDFGAGYTYDLIVENAEILK